MTNDNRGRFAIVPAVLFDPDSGASAREIAVYGALALHADERGECWPSIGRLASMVGVSDPTVSKALDVLASLGAVTILTRFRETGGQTSNVYRLHAWGLRAPAVEDSREGVDEVPRSKESLGGVQRILGGGGKESLDELEPLELEPLKTTSARPAKRGPRLVEVDGIKLPAKATDLPRKGSRLQYPAPFEEFWAVYPVKSGKRRAYERYVQAVRDADPVEILAGARAYALWVQANPDRRPKWAEGWLNAGRWEDDTPGDSSGAHGTATAYISYAAGLMSGQIDGAGVSGMVRAVEGAPF